MKAIRIFLLLLLFPAFTFAQYKVVLKSGKVIEGKYLHEDSLNVYIQSGGIKMNFKKEKLDLAKMKELNAKQETPVAEATSSMATGSTTATKSTSSKSKKPARVYTSEDLQNMKEVWNESATQSAPSEPQTQMAEVAEMQTQSMPTAEPRDEEAIRADIESTKIRIMDAEKQIKDLRAKGRVTQTWEKMVSKMQDRLKDLDTELKDAVTARKAAAKAAAQTQPE
jgi:hypothetical protein